MENVLLPYKHSKLSKLVVIRAITQSKQLTVQMDVVNGATCTLVKSAELTMRKKAMAEFLVVSNVVDRVKVNKTFLNNGRPTKCLTLPKSICSKKKWQAIVNIFDIEDEDVVDPEAACVVETVTDTVVSTTGLGLTLGSVVPIIVIITFGITSNAMAKKD